jgi:hypothetical protein
MASSQYRLARAAKRRVIARFDVGTWFVLHALRAEVPINQAFTQGREILIQDPYRRHPFAFVNASVLEVLSHLPPGYASMAFIVQTYQPKTSVPTSITIERRDDALKTARHLAERGHVGVRIIGDGRIYSPAEFSLTVETPVFLPSG